MKIWNCNSFFWSSVHPFCERKIRDVELDSDINSLRKSMKINENWWTVQEITEKTKDWEKLQNIRERATFWKCINLRNCISSCRSGAAYFEREKCARSEFNKTIHFGQELRKFIEIRACTHATGFDVCSFKCLDVSCRSKFILSVIFWVEKK